MILKNKNFSKLYLAGLTSELGSFITDTALMLLVFSLTNNDKSYIGFNRAAFLFFLTIGGILGGPIGERFNRRNILLLCNTIRIPILGFLFIYRGNPELVILSNGLIALFTGIYNPSRQALINELVPAKHIEKANSLFGSTFAILHIIGPMAGAYLYSTYQGVELVLSIDLFTYILGLILLYLISYSAPTKNQEQSGFFGELKKGATYISKRKDLKTLFINCSLNGACIGLLIPLLLPYVQEELLLGEKEYGILIGVFGIGGFFGGILSSYFSKLLSPGKILVGTISIEPLIFLLWVATKSYLASLVIFFLWGFIVFMRISSQLNHISKTVETKYLTRMHALLDLSFIIPNIGSGIAIALLGDSFTTMSILKLTAILFFIFIIPRLFFSGMKNLFGYNETIERKTYKD